MHSNNALLPLALMGFSPAGVITRALPFPRRSRQLKLNCLKHQLDECIGIDPGTARLWGEEVGC